MSAKSDSAPIVPPATAPPSGNVEAGARPGKGRGFLIARAVSLVVLVVLLGIAAYVFFVLPQLVDERRRTVAVPATEPAASAADTTAPERVVPPLPAKRDAPAKSEAERRLSELLSKKTALEAQAVSVWGGQDYQHALARLDAADAAFARGEFELAARTYQDVMTAFAALENSKTERFERALDAGARALTAADGSEAKAQFLIAQSIDPRDPRAKRGLERAETIAEVAARVAQGERLEQEDKLDAAQQSYAAALALDGEYEAARVGLERVSEKLTARRFQRAMSDALNALHAGRFDAARSALDAASAARPGAAEIGDARAQLRTALQSRNLDRLRAQAATLEAEERWQEAADTYAKALAVDPDLQFARAGQQRSAHVARLRAQIDLHLSAPQGLQFQQARDHAHKLLTAAGALEVPSPKLARRADELARRIEAAEQPVEVVLRSDGETEVSVHRVGRFGRFTQRTVALRPGTYTAVGSRPGYRDVRTEFTLGSEQRNAPIVIRCEERI